MRGSTASTTSSIVSAISCWSASASALPPPTRAETTRSKSKWATELLPVHHRHPCPQLTTLVDASLDALCERFGLLARHLHFDERRRRTAFLDQLDAIHGGERAERLADSLVVNVVGKISDNDTHLFILH